MIRTDAPGVSRPINQVQIGSAQGRGSSGGPWVANFGAGMCLTRHQNTITLSSFMPTHKSAFTWLI